MIFMRPTIGTDERIIVKGSITYIRQLNLFKYNVSELVTNMIIFTL